MAEQLRLVSTCPESCTLAPEELAPRVRATARWCEEAGHEGLLIHSDQRLADPWALAQIVLAEVDRLRPVVTVQPTAQHPYETAKKLATLAQLFGRAPHVVLAAGGFKEDLLALGDRTAHDERYRRLVEYGRVVQLLIGSSARVDFDGEYYRLHKPVAPTAIEPGAAPEWFVAGSSAAGRDAARALGAIAVSPFDPSPADGPLEAIRVGLLARATGDEAREAASARFPESRARRLEHRIGMMWSDSSWQQQLQRAAAEGARTEAWTLAPYEHGYAQVPYLVGEYRAVARELLPALQRGARWLFLDAPADAADLAHGSEVLTRAWRRLQTPLALTG